MYMCFCFSVPFFSFSFFLGGVHSSCYAAEYRKNGRMGGGRRMVEIGAPSPQSGGGIEDGPSAKKEKKKKKEKTDGMEINGSLKKLGIKNSGHGQATSIAVVNEYTKPK